MSDPAQSFYFPEHLILEESSTKDYFKELLQGLVHKNNNMLGVIQGFSSLILMDDDVDPGIRENVQQMKDSASGATDLAKVILTTAGCARVEAESISLNDCMPHMETKARALGEAHGVKVDTKVSENLPNVMADSNRLNEMLDALVLNAVESAKEIPNGEVAIDVLPPGSASPAEENRVDLFVRNSSENLPMDQMEKIFAPFHSDKGNDHCGIGLTTAAVIAGQMGVKLGMRSAEGTTTVWLSFPVA